MRFAMWFMLAVLGVVGFASLREEGEQAPVRAALAAADTAPGFGPKNYSEALAIADMNVAARRARLASAPGEWLHQEFLALALMQRHRLGGAGDDLAEARELLDAGLASAPDPAGPALSRAALALDLHDLDRAERELARFSRSIAPAPQELSEASAMQGDIAFQRGDLAAALASYRQADRGEGATGVAMRLANHALWSGKPSDAAVILEKAMAANTPGPNDYAQIALQRANIAYAAGDLAKAREWIDAANQRFAGYWLAQVYDAQQNAAEGELATGIGQLESLAEQTGDPAVMDLVAGFLLHTGQDKRAADWVARSEREWSARLAEHRAAYRLHAAEHFLDFGDPAKALQLAREEVAARPFGEAIEVYASALVATGKPAKALEWLDRADDAGWRSVSLFMARAEALAELGRTEAARQATEEGLALSGMAEDPMRKLLRFGHY